jgi:hypothetical protein
MKYIAMLLSLAILVSAGSFAAQALAAETKNRKLYCGLALSLPPKGLPNILPATSVLTLCSLQTIQQTFPALMLPSSLGPGLHGIFTRQGSTCL